MVILGLGSNKGDRTEYLRAAISLLRGVLSDMRVSTVYESKALLPKGASSDWDRLFLNMAVAGHSSLSPEALLAELKAMEKNLGRKPAMAWSPREIDLDILAMDQIVFDTPALHVPHPELLNRDFALVPFVDLAPDWIYPVPGEYQGWRAADILKHKKYGLGKTLWKINMEPAAAYA